MKINLASSNPALKSIFNEPYQIITLDANLLIPPDRSKYRVRAFPFNKYQQIWLDPIFETFPRLAIHEAVYEEIVSPSVKSYIDININKKPPRLIIHRDSSLTTEEQILRNSIEEKIYPHTKYDPILDNKNDRGEVKSLSYIAVKGLLYFAAHDSNAIQLIEKAELIPHPSPANQFEWKTAQDHLTSVGIV